MNSPASPQTPRFLVLSALLAVQVLFGIGYLTSKLIVGRWPALVWAGARVDISAALMFAIAWASGRPRPQLSRGFLGSVLFASLFGIVINQGSFLVGLTYTTATNSAVLNTLIPLFTAALVAARGQERLSGVRLLGLAVSVAGVLLLCRVEQFSFAGGSWMGDALTLVNCLSYAIFLTFAKPFLSRIDPLWATAWIFLVGGLLLTLASVPQWPAFHWAGLDRTLALSAVFAILGTTLLAYFLNFWALSKSGSTQVALFVYAQPVVAAILSWVLFGESVTARTGAASALIFAGLFLGLRRAAPRVRLPGAVEISGRAYPLADLSEGGFGFFAPVGTNLLAGLELTATLNVAGERIEVRAKVLSMTTIAGRRRFGCQFRNLSPQAGSAVARLTKTSMNTTP